MAGTLTLEPDPIREAIDRLAFRTQAFIDGRFVDAADGRTYVSENPATGGRLADVAQGSARDVDLAVAAARRAADSGVWSGMAPADRKRVLVRFADLIDVEMFRSEAVGNRNRTIAELQDCSGCGRRVLFFLLPQFTVLVLANRAHSDL
jgi:hypothetical protein